MPRYEYNSSFVALSPGPNSEQYTCDCSGFVTRGNIS